MIYFYENTVQFKISLGSVETLIGWGRKRS